LCFLIYYMCCEGGYAINPYKADKPIKEHRNMGDWR
jgi:hypothetical protein